MILFIAAIVLVLCILITSGYVMDIYVRGWIIFFLLILMLLLMAALLWPKSLQNFDITQPGPLAPAPRTE